MSMLRIDLLGEVRAWSGEREIDLGPPRRRAVLAILALRANQPVSRSEIVDGVWGDRPPASAVNGVHLYIGALRQVLEPRRGRHEPGRLLVRSGSGYLLRLLPGQLDLHQFEAYVQRAKNLAGAGDLAAAVSILDAALGMWRGGPLAGVTGPLVDLERRRLAEARLNAFEERAEAMLALGRHAELVADLSAAAAEHPLRERLRGLLMVALDRSSRRAEALAVFADARRHLVEELGIEPGAELRRLQRRILADDVDGPDHDPRPPLTWPTTPRPVPRQLPSAARHFAGRVRELAALKQLADEAARSPVAVVIAAISGPASIGKSTLALHWAHRVAAQFPDGQLYVNLRGRDTTGPAPTTAEVINGFLDAWGIPTQQRPANLASALGLYRSLLADQRVLLLLDDARDAEQVRALLPGSRTCLVVVTSRERLTGLAAAEGAHLMALDGLPAEEARGLLASHLGERRVARHRATVDEVVSRCAGRPQALAMVAAQAAAQPDVPLPVAMADAGRERSRSAGGSA